jgi:peptidoglycan/LPS O-acetylase OafA/YrhL
MLTFDTLRFVAAMGILLHHSNAFLYASADRIASKEQSWGLALLVDLFFVISGYVIAFVYGGRTTSTAEFFSFMRKRIARLLPLHLFTLVVFLTFYLLALRLGFKIGSLPDISAGCLAKTALLLHAVLPCDGPAVNTVNWSISAEMAMYVVFPIAYYLIGRTLWTAAAGLTFATAAIILLSWGLTAKEWTEIYAPLRAFPSFCFGISLFRIVDGLGHKLSYSKLVTNALLFVGLLVLAGAMMTGVSATLVLVLILAACGLAALIDKSGSASVLTVKIAPLGQLTYSIYMVHLLLVTSFVNVIGDKILKLDFWPMLVVIILNALLTIIVSHFTFAWIERPARRFLTSSRITRR